MKSSLQGAIATKQSRAEAWLWIASLSDEIGNSRFLSGSQ